MSDPPHSPVQAAAKVAESAVEGLARSPWLLAIVALNIVSLAAGVWFLRELLQLSQNRWEMVFKICQQMAKP